MYISMHEGRKAGPERGLKQRLRAEDVGAHELRRARSATLPVCFQ
ncbi:hypothetical protein [Streptomyces atratus]